MASETLDERLREALDRSLAARELRLNANPIVAVRSRVARHQRRRRAVVIAATAGVAAVVGSVLVLTRDGDDRGQDVDVVAPPDTAPVQPTDPVVGDPSGVEPLPAPPLDGRGDAAVVWTGAELVVWGGDVEAFNMGFPGGDRSYSDGAAFAPATGTWRRLSSSPLPDNGETPVGVMTGAGVVVVRGHSTALWNAADDTWRELGNAPGPVTDLASNSVAAVSYSANAVLDVETGEWRELPAPPIRLERPTTAWAERELIVVGGSPSAFGPAGAIAYDPEDNEWRQLAPPPSALRAEALSADWDGGRVVVVNYDMTAVTYDPATDSWAELSSVPARFFEWQPTLRSSAGTSVVFMAQAIVVLTGSDAWVPVPYGKIPSGSVVATANGELFVWSVNADSATNTLTAVDLNRVVERPHRVQVGVGNTELGADASLIEATYGEVGTEEVRAVIEHVDGSRCTVTSVYGTGAIDQPVEETLDNDGRPTTWHRDSGGQTWQTVPTTSDVFTIDCDQADSARALANSASFGAQ